METWDDFAPGSAVVPTAEVELTLSCRGLKGKDLLSKSDPACVTFIQPFGENRWIEYHRTECVSNCHDPDFVSKVNLAYRFEEQQKLKFEVYDIDNTSSKLINHDFLGVAECNLSQILANSNVKLPLATVRGGVGDGSNGYLLIAAEELSSLKDEAVLQFSGVKLENKHWFGKISPFLVIYKSTEVNVYSIVYQTEIAKHTVDPKWKRFSVTLASLCNCDWDRNMKIECRDGSGSKSTFIGEIFVTLRELCDSFISGKPFQLQNPYRRSGKSKSPGELRVDYFEQRQITTFLDYIRGGTELHCSIAIDFTGSNGDPTSPDSLHHISNVPNLYEQAIISVGGIIQDYDSDKQFPVLGFGARLPPDGRISHEFFVNMDPSNPYCAGINGVLQAYRTCIQQVQLYGPTNFAPVINHVARFASSFKTGTHYFILLILTDGIITDMPQTVQAIIKASSLPFSIIIVGVGNADFTAMETLDADVVTLEYDGVKAKRDIVQFVPFNKFLSVGDPKTARKRLAREVLAEIPKQFLSYMKENNITPKSPQLNITVLPPDPEIILKGP